MNKEQQQVRDFMIACDQEVHATPTTEDFPYQLRMDMIHEEADEFANACFEEASEQNPIKKNHKKADMVDALVDILYVTYGAANAMGVDLEEYFQAVHEANMKKVGKDGKVKKSSSGKVLKPKGWKPADLRSILLRDMGFNK